MAAEGSRGGCGVRREATELRPLAEPSPLSPRSLSHRSDLSRSPDPDFERFRTGLCPGDEPGQHNIIRFIK